MARTGRPRVERVEVACTGCGKLVLRYPSEIQRNKTGKYFCSEECGKAFGYKPRTGEYVPCAVCGTEIYRNQTDIRLGKKYCSYACHDVAQTKPKTQKSCLSCGSVMILSPSQIARDYCKRSCYERNRGARHTGRLHNDRPVLKNYHGYITVYEPSHPAAWKHSGRVFEHRLIMEKALGRFLTADEQVDHINGVKDDNRLENLQILTASEHASKSNSEQKAKLEHTLLEQLQEYKRRYGALED